MNGPVLLSIIAMSLALGFWLGMEARRPPRYHGVSLHDGRWGKPKLEGNGRLLRVKWERLDANKEPGFDHAHEPMQCSIGPSLAHTDVCACGAQRYGVYGPWS